LKKIISVVGARPNFMKVAPLHRSIQKYQDSIQHFIVHTGQHYDQAMSKVFFQDLELPNPNVYLGVGSGSHAQQTAKIMVEFEKVVEEQKPDLVVVVGDVNSTLACSLVAAKMGVRIAHVEAGLRSFDRTMPEEINRLTTDALSDFLFVSEPSGIANLRREGTSEDKMFFVGNVMIDSLIHYREKARRSEVPKTLGLKPQEYILVTLHRPSNVDHKLSLQRIIDVLRQLSQRITVVFPIHPRTRKMITQFDMDEAVRSIHSLILTDPLGYLDFLSLMDSSTLLITDSGGIQEETTFLQIPCLTLRENTERPITVEVGTNQLCGKDIESVVSKSLDIMNGKAKQGRVPDLWDGKTGERIVQIIFDKLGVN
jgi:UDP-N-acetylglucosamine 2-epimerase (non-hydrolysing)